LASLQQEHNSSYQTWHHCSRSTAEEGVADNKSVDQEYLCRCKKGVRQKENTMESLKLKSFNLACILEAEEMGMQMLEKVDHENYVG
jgi:uncharacterized protein (UPF0303 family)